MKAKLLDRPWLARALSNLSVEFEPQPFVHSLTTGFLAGLLEILLALVFAALIFGGDLAESVPVGTGVLLLGAAVAAVIVSIMGSLPGSMSGNQDSPVAIMAVVAAGISAKIAAGATEDQDVLSTVLVAMALTTLLTGLVFFLLGVSELGGLVRFLPYPVVGGFLAGTGWLLVSGAVTLMAGESSLSTLVDPDVLIRWLPGLILALAIVTLSPRLNHPFFLPFMIIAGLAVFYGVAWIQGVGGQELQDQGWLLGPFPESGLIQPLPWSRIGQVHWEAVVSQLPNILALVVLSAVSLLLNASGLETIADRDISLNRELRAAGVSNLAVGVLGGVVTYQQLSLSALRIRLGKGGRLAGIVVAALCILSLFWGASFLSMFPRVVAGGLLLFLGLDFLKEWVVDARSRMPLAEYAIVFFILLVIGLVGFLEGVFVGVIAVVVMFIFAYSRVDVVRNELSGRIVGSRLNRPARVRVYLRQAGEQVYILQLAGFLFFGTADRLYNQIKARLDKRTGPSIRFVIMDFRRITGLDSTGLSSLRKICKHIQVHKAQLLFTGLSPDLRRHFSKSGLVASGHLHFFDNLDKGVEWCEERLLEERGSMADPSSESLVSQLQAIVPDGLQVEILLPFLERVEMNAGDYLMVQGGKPDDMFFIESGQVTAQLEEPDRPPVRLETSRAGAVVGELGLYLNQARTASVVVDQPGVAYRLTRQQMAHMQENEPEAAATLHWLIVHLLAGRVTNMISVVQVLEQ